VADREEPPCFGYGIFVVRIGVGAGDHTGPCRKLMKNRKKNRLADYDYSQPGAYFITVCVEDRRPILSTVVGVDDHIDPQVQLSRIGAVVDKYTKTIPGIGHYVIMPNHVHMILHISAKDPGSGPMCLNRAPTEGAEFGPMWSSAPTEGAEFGPMCLKRSPTEGAEFGPMCINRAPTEANISDLVRTWKTLITKELGQSIWQRSYYDHIIRSEQEYFEIAEYIMGNPGRWVEDKYYLEN